MLQADSLGLTVHPEKSIIIPSQRIDFVGFEINSVNMTVKLTKAKAQNIRSMCEEFLHHKEITIREFAQLIGKMVAADAGVRYAPLYYKSMEIQRDLELKKNYGRFDAYMVVWEENRKCLQWWIENIEQSYKPILLGQPDRIIESDST